MLKTKKTKDEPIRHDGHWWIPGIIGDHKAEKETAKVWNEKYEKLKKENLREEEQKEKGGGGGILEINKTKSMPFIGNRLNENY